MQTQVIGFQLLNFNYMPGDVYKCLPLCVCMLMRYFIIMTVYIQTLKGHHTSWVWVNTAVHSAVSGERENVWWLINNIPSFTSATLKIMHVKMHKSMLNITIVFLHLCVIMPRLNINLQRQSVYCHSKWLLLLSPALRNTLHLVSMMSLVKFKHNCFQVCAECTRIVSNFLCCDSSKFYPFCSLWLILQLRRNTVTHAFSSVVWLYWLVTQEYAFSSCRWSVGPFIFLWVQEA